MKSTIFIFFAIFLFSCVLDFNPKMLNIRNRYKSDVIVCISHDSIFNDSNLFYGTKIGIRPNEIIDYHGVSLESTFFVFLFDKDSVDSNIMNNKLKQITQKSFLDKYLLSKDSLNKDDTLVFDEWGKMALIHGLSRK
jgi:hypothetical protein